MHRSGVVDEHYAGPTRARSCTLTRSSQDPQQKLTSPRSARRSLRRLMNQCPSHRALLCTVSFTETTHSQPRQSDSHSIDMTAKSLHRAFLQQKGCPWRATVAICLLRASSYRCSKLSCGSTATYPGPHGRASTRGRGQGITRSGAAPVANHEHGINSGHTCLNSQRLPASAPT
jgi:hypothetical protein